MKSADHFQWRDLREALLANGWANRVTEIDLLEKQIHELAQRRSTLCNEYLKDVIYNHASGAMKFKFRPCHARKLDTLTVSTWISLV